jgi:hypothetical protein
MLAVTIAGVVMPVWLWRADLSSRSLHFRLISQTSLQPADTASLPDLKLTVDGAELVSPFLTVVELLNDGNRPVPSSDFEGPIQLVVSKPSSIVKARITAKNPKELMTQLVTDPSSIQISPFLINPGDSLTIAVVTSGPLPNFEPRARIAGLRTLPIEDSVKGRLTTFEKLLLVLGAVVCMIGPGFVAPWFPLKGVYLRPRAGVLIIFVGGVTAASLMDSALSAWGVYGL